MAGEQTPWPTPPREPGPWGGGPPVAPPGNTPLPPLPGASGVMESAPSAVNPWSATGPAQPLPVPGGAAPFPGLPPSSGPRVDRAPAFVRVLAGLVVLAMVAGAGYVVLKGTSDPYPDAWDARVDPIAEWVAEARGLEFDHPVQVNFLSAEAYTEATGGGEDPVTEGDAASEADDESAEAQAATLGQLRALGLLSGDPDLESANQALSDSGTLAFYSPDTKQVYVRGTKMTPALEVTIAHELTHVLQDQRFDLERMADMTSTDATVFRALAEGDAGRIEEQYVADVLTAEERTAYEAEATKAGADAEATLADEVPAILTTLFSAPYVLGPRLVSYLAADGPAKIDAALTDVPSEEVLFDPLTFDTAAAEPKDVTVDPPEGIEEDERDDFGPVALYLVLAARLDPSTALAAVDGWGGDEYVAYEQDEKVCVRIAVETDTPADATQLTDALTAWTAMSPDTSSVAEEGGATVLQSCDPGADAPAVGDQDRTDLLQLPATRVDAYLAQYEAGATDEQARCFATGLLEQATLENLTDEAWFSGPGEQVIATVALGCR